jgi:hypothetical protein
MASRVAASSPSSRWLAGAGRVASGMPTASTPTDRFKADQAASTRDAPRTIGLAQSALQHGRRLTSRGRAVALQQLAVGYALAGDEVACQRALDTAAQLAERSQQDHDEGPGRYCTPAYVEIHRAATWIELGRPERAINLFEDSLATLPSVHLVWAPLGDLGVCESGNVGCAELLVLNRGAPT